MVAPIPPPHAHPPQAGDALLSRLPLVAPDLRFLVLDTVPSVRTGVKLKNGEKIRLYAVHPEPPVPYEDTIGRDGELVLIAAEVTKDPLPAIVTGDLNDVAWSRTTRRFQRLTGLLDPRVGRGLFSTFDARVVLQDFETIAEHSRPSGGKFLGMCSGRASQWELLGSCWRRS